MCIFNFYKPSVLFHFFIGLCAEPLDRLPVPVLRLGRAGDHLRAGAQLAGAGQPRQPAHHHRRLRHQHARRRSRIRRQEICQAGPGRDQFRGNSRPKKLKFYLNFPAIFCSSRTEHSET